MYKQTILKLRDWTDVNACNIVKYISNMHVQQNKIKNM